MKQTRPDIEALLASLASRELAAIAPGLERVEALLAALGHPERKLPPVIHVAGTNGKGSLMAYLSATFECAGLRAHRYISPHLVRFNERIALAGEDIADEALLALLARVKEKTSAHPVTFFEATTVAAFLAFAEAKADVVLLETGMGGRLDATNMVERPALTVITPVSMDHSEYLGNTLAAIAGEKAGIIKRGVPCVIGPQAEEAAHVIAAAAKAAGARAFAYGQDWTVEKTSIGGVYRSSRGEVEFAPALPGEHQLANAGTAIACMELLGDFDIPEAVIRQGIAEAKWPARLQKLDRGALHALIPHTSTLWLDGGHNPDAGRALGAWAASLKGRLELVCGMVEGKDTESFLRALAPYAARVHAVDIPGEPTGKSAAAIAQTAERAGIQSVMQPSVKAAVRAAGQAGAAHILVCGSLYLAGKVLWMNAIQPDEEP